MLFARLVTASLFPPRKWFANLEAYAANRQKSPSLEGVSISPPPGSPVFFGPGPDIPHQGRIDAQALAILKYEYRLWELDLKLLAGFGSPD